MNPASVAQAPPAKLMQDVAPPKVELLKPSAPIRAEMVQDIPVHSPLAVPAAANLNPISSTPAATPPAASQADKALDIILKDVTKAVKHPLAASSPKFAPPSKAKSQPAHVLPIITALMVAGVLIAAAVYSFRYSQNSSAQINFSPPTAYARN